MARMGNFTAADLRNLQRQLNRIQQHDVEQFLEDCAKELTARLLAMVIKRTPVGDYSHEVEVVAKRDSSRHRKGERYKKRVNTSGRVGGTLRRGWTSATQEEAAGGRGAGTNARAYAESLTVQHTGNLLTVEVVNPVEYASYVEYGHRTRNHQGWVPGRFMLTISEQELQRTAPRILERKIQRYLEACMEDDS